VPIDANYVLSASMDVTSDAEATFNDVYDTEHVLSLGAVPGVLSIVRFERTELRMSIGGEVVAVAPGDAPRYTAFYELESPEVLVSDGWAHAIEQGRWPAEVRPHTLNRRHVLLRRMTT
jgi:hypothetical protein